ncbi:MAG TPA: potassium channel protein [Gemmataceae bacterium]|nr:potassium channel protein [Gemmataceae bacterium]
MHRANRPATTRRVPPRRLILIVVIPTLLILAGTLGYHLLEGWSLFDSLYFTVVTLTTIGYGDLTPKTDGGKLFTMVLVLGGVFTLFYLAADSIRAVVSGEVRAHLGKQRMERTLAEMKDHLVVCGYGRMGKLVCRDFSAQGVRFVVIDRDEEALADFALPGGAALHGDATSDEMLRAAGVERARALVTVAPSDADNLYVTMSARLLNDRLFIVARAETENARRMLERAGANRVVSPYVIGGSRVAQAVLRPTVVDFIDLATRTEHFDLQIEETRLAAGSALVGHTLKDNQLRERFGVIVVAIKKESGHMVYNPPGDARLEGGDILIALGQRRQLDELDRLAGG